VANKVLVTCTFDAMTVPYYNSPHDDNSQSEVLIIHTTAPY